MLYDKKQNIKAINKAKELVKNSKFASANNELVHSDVSDEERDLFRLLILEDFEYENGQFPSTMGFLNGLIESFEKFEDEE